MIIRMASFRPAPSLISGGGELFGPGLPWVALRSAVSNDFMVGFGNSPPHFGRRFTAAPVYLGAAELLPAVMARRVSLRGQAVVG